MPMITICPVDGNANNLLYNLLKRDENCAGDFAAQLTRALAVERIKKSRDERQLKYFDNVKAREMFLPCEEEEEARLQNEECKFVLLLAAIAKAMSRKEIPDDPDLVLEFLVEKTVARETPTLTDLKSYVERKGKAKLGEYEQDDLMLSLEKTIYLYTYFFPVYKFPDKKTMGVLMNIGQFQPPEIVHIQPGDLADFLAHMIDRGVMLDKDKEAFVVKILSRCMASHLKVEDHDMLSRMNNFNYFAGFYFGYVSGYSRAYPCGDEHGNWSTLAERCLNPGTEECRKYCDIVMLTDKQKRRMRDLFGMAQGDVGPINSSNPVSILPYCQFPGEGHSASNCWKPSLTHTGVCFSNAMGKSYKWSHTCFGSGHGGWQQRAGQVRVEIRQGNNLKLA